LLYSCCIGVVQESNPFSILFNPNLYSVTKLGDKILDKSLELWPDRLKTLALRPAQPNPTQPESQVPDCSAFPLSSSRAPFLSVDGEEEEEE
jgi:hypothetical protein